MIQLDRQNAVLDRMLNPVAECFTPDVARKIANLQADETTQNRLDELAEKANEGSLTPAEREEYEACVEAIDLIALLQAKARSVLKTMPSQ
jgi:hypothetical protein